MSNTQFSFSLFGNRYYFTPKFAFPTFILFFAFLGIGAWQLKCAQTINATFELLNKRLLLAPVKLDTLQKEPNQRFYPVILTGSFDNEHSLLLTQRTAHAEEGYEVITPFKPTDATSEILVNRGWVAAEANKLPELAPVTEEVTVTGILVKPEMNLFAHLRQKDSAAEWPRVVTYLDIGLLSSTVGNPLYPYVLLLSPRSPGGFTREWLAQITALDPNQHTIYAMQAFALAFVILIIFIFVNTQSI